ncbi:MAG: hypothetical protein WAN69_05425 [Candidatus Korobacteraceae bacterium]
MVCKFGAETWVLSLMDPPDEEGPQEAADGLHQIATASAAMTIESFLD